MSAEKAKSGSKTNLNESNMPLLDDEKAEKETIELKDHKEEGENNHEEDGKKDGKKEKKEKKKKEKKEKVPKEKKPSFIQTMTTGLNMMDRDDKNVNQDVNISFEDVIAEPEASQGIDGIWRLTFILFSKIKFWTYRILSAILALPLAIIWAVFFALITFVYIWVITPILKILAVLFAVLRKIWVMVIGTTVEPFFEAFGACFSRVNFNHTITRKVDLISPDLDATRLA